jgi:tRNA-specific 2-thiouridylase
MRSIFKKRPNTSATNKKVYVGLSGGVDSAVSAALLKEEGYKVTGVFIRIAIEGYPCPAAQDRIEAMRVAAHLKIPFIEIDLSKEYETRVFDFSVREFSKGHTPNPDALCNREIKFGLFYDFARTSGADFVATGHYARVSEGKLFMGADANKDQTYFLWAVPAAHLKHVLFPVGNLEKPQVRKLAHKFGLPNSARPDSQGLCFLGDISIEDMLAREVKLKPGEVFSESGEVIGSHKGAALYTLGQRHGFELFNQTHDASAHFVVKKDIGQNTITVSPDRYPSSAKQTQLELEDMNWIGDAPSGHYEARFRYRQKLINATLTREGNSAKVLLNEPQYAPEGQSLVLYRGDRCFGGGIIKKATLQ